MKNLSIEVHPYLEPDQGEEYIQCKIFKELTKFPQSLPSQEYKLREFDIDAHRYFKYNAHRRIKIVFHTMMDNPNSLHVLT